VCVQAVQVATRLAGRTPIIVKLIRVFGLSLVDVDNEFAGSSKKDASGTKEKP
jgi:hypothetical protein